MDRLFKYKTDEMLMRLMKIEPEMVETSYNDTDMMVLRELSGQAHMYIAEIFKRISTLYAQEERTILNMMRELYRIAVTEEYSVYQNMDELTHKNRIFSQINQKDDFPDVIFAARLLRYYYLVYEKYDQPPTVWEKLNEVYNKFFQISELKMEEENKELSARESVRKERFIPELKKHMDTYMIGQDILKKKLCVLLYLWIYNQNRTNFLIVGPSGSGKNHIINTISNFTGLGRKVISYDCSGLTPSGFTGADVKDIFDKLKAACDHDNLPVEGSIVYLDEIDKIINFCHDSDGESVNAMVQQQLLACLAGTATMQDIDTSKILFILGGAFPRIDDLRKMEKRGMGFNARFDDTENFDINLRQQICEIGGEREFVGRIGEIVRIKKLTRDELKAILMDKKIGVFTLKKKLYEEAGFELEIQEEAIDGILDLIEKEDLGARSVGNIMNELADSRYFYDMMMEGYSKMIIHQGMLKGEAPVFRKKGRIRNEKIRRYCERL